MFVLVNALLQIRHLSPLPKRIQLQIRRIRRRLRRRARRQPERNHQTEHIYDEHILVAELCTDASDHRRGHREGGARVGSVEQFAVHFTKAKLVGVGKPVGLGLERTAEHDGRVDLSVKSSRT